MKPANGRVYKCGPFFDRLNSRYCEFLGLYAFLMQKQCLGNLILSFVFWLPIQIAYAILF